MKINLDFRRRKAFAHSVMIVLRRAMRCSNPTNFLMSYSLNLAYLQVLTAQNPALSFFLMVTWPQEMEVSLAILSLSSHLLPLVSSEEILLVSQASMALPSS